MVYTVITESRKDGEWILSSAYSAKDPSDIVRYITALNGTTKDYQNIKILSHDFNQLPRKIKFAELEALIETDLKNKSSPLPSPNLAQIMAFLQLDRSHTSPSV